MKQSFEIDVSVVLGGGLSREVTALKRELQALHRTTSLSRAGLREFRIKPIREQGITRRSNLLSEGLFGYNAKGWTDVYRSGVARLRERRRNSADEVAISGHRTEFVIYRSPEKRSFWERPPRTRVAAWKPEISPLRASEEKETLKKALVGKAWSPISGLEIHRLARAKQAFGYAGWPPRGRMLRPDSPSAFSPFPEAREPNYKPYAQNPIAIKPAYGKSMRTERLAAHAPLMMSRPFGSRSSGQSPVMLTRNFESAKPISPRVFAQHGKYVLSGVLKGTVAAAPNGAFTKSGSSAPLSDAHQPKVYPFKQATENPSTPSSLAPKATAALSFQDAQIVMIPSAERSLGVPQMGAVYLDGRLVGRWVSDYLANEAAGAPSARVSFDSRLGFPWPGPPIAN